MNIAILCTRIESERLPGKVLKPLGDKLIIDWIIERLKATGVIDKIVIAVPNNIANQIILKHCINNYDDLYYYVGDNDNVIKRFLNAAQLYCDKGSDNLIRVTHDCPLLNIDMMKEIIKIHEWRKCIYSSNVYPCYTIPDGWDFEIFRLVALEQQYKKCIDTFDLSIRENITPGMWTFGEYYNYLLDKNMSKIKLSVDTQKDYEFVKKCVAEGKYV